MWEQNSASRKFAMSYEMRRIVKNLFLQNPMVVLVSLIITRPQNPAIYSIYEEIKSFSGWKYCHDVDLKENVLYTFPKRKVGEKIKMTI